MVNIVGAKENLQKICSCCTKYAGNEENVQKICMYYRKCAENVLIAENVQKICSYCRKYGEHLRILQRMCRKSAGIAENVQKTCRYYRISAGRVAENLQVLQKMCRNSCRYSKNICSYCRKYAERNTCKQKQNTSEITEDNIVKTTANGSTNIGDVIMPRIRKRSTKDFVTKGKEKQGLGTKSLRNRKRVPQWRLDLKLIMHGCWETLLKRQSLKISRSLTLFFTPWAVFFPLSIMKLNIFALKPINSRRVSFYWNGTCDLAGSQNYQGGLDPLACPCKHLPFGYDSRDYQYPWTT